MAELLKWITGASTIPPLGLPRKIQITFLHGCNSACKCRPTVSTCQLLRVKVHLPVHVTDDEEMLLLMTSALKDCVGFGHI